MFPRAIRIFGINQIGPVVVSASRSRYKHYCRRTGAAAFDIYLATAADVDQAATVAGFRSRSENHLKEANKSYNKEKTHARKEIMISIAGVGGCFYRVLAISIYFGRRTYSRLNS
jgi:hypothetical protein